MIRTLNRLGKFPSWSFAHPCPPMTADVVEPVHPARFIAHNDQTLSRNLCEQIIACVFQLALMPHAKPFGRKDVLPFFCKDLLGDKIFLREGFRTSAESFDSFAKSAH